MLFVKLNKGHPLEGLQEPHWQSVVSHNGKAAFIHVHAVPHVTAGLGSTALRAATAGKVNV